VKCAGAFRRENVGMSNRKSGERPDRRKPKVSSAMAIIGGLGAPKRNPALGQGIAMDSRLIFRPRLYVDGMTDYIRSSALLDLTFLPVEQEPGKSGSGRKACSKV